MPTKPVEWIGTVPTCNFCQKSLVSVFVDGKTNLGPWATMCLDCHRVNGLGLGTGLGQKYQRNADGKWYKVGG